MHASRSFNSPKAKRQFAAAKQAANSSAGALVVLGLFLSACGPTRYVVAASAFATGADAEVIADAVQDQGLVRLTVQATNLPPPARIKEGMSHFVVWQRKDSGTPWARVAALQYDEGARTGGLESVTVGQLQFDLIITAESAADVASPSEVTVFSQRVTPS